MIEMTYEDAYREYFSVIVKYCAYQVDNNIFYAEEIASETFLTLYKKWNEFSSHEPRVLIVWLYRTANYKVKEHYRLSFPEYMNIDDKKVENLIEKRLLENAFEPDAYEGFKKYDQYISKIKSMLKEEEWLLFEYIIVKEYSYRQIANELKVSEAAIKMRWYRLQVKIYPHVMRLLEKEM